LSGPTEGTEALAARVREWATSPLDLRCSWRMARWTALDLETTGLDPRTDAILSIGLVDIEGGRVLLDTAWNSLVRPPPGAVFRPESVLVHGLTPDSLVDAPAQAEILPALVARLRGRVVIAHSGQEFDGPLLDRAFREGCGEPFPGPLLDTARLAHHLHDQAVPGKAPAGPSVRLADLAARHGVPSGRAHDALDDALTCAQVFLVLATHMEALGHGSAARLLKCG
jgi:DNA polymerase-3 subunit epsilon